MASKTLSRRILEPSLASSSSPICVSCRIASLSLSRPQRRHAANVSRAKDARITRATSHIQDFLKKSPASLMKKPTKASPPTEVQSKEVESKQKLEPIQNASSTQSPNTPSEDSIFGPVPGEAPPAPTPETEEDATTTIPKAVHSEIDPSALLNVLDPEPGKTMAWRRKKLIQQIRKRGVLTKAEQIARTERQITVPSPVFQTSTKKLMYLAQQIAGKPIEEAIVQMQLSKKRVAQDIRRHLEYARDLAVVERGMGLGKVEGTAGEKVEIELKDGRRKVVEDRTGIYVDQAWVNKGEETMTPEYRGRGRVFRLTHRSAKMTVMLKEEATRIRLSQERMEKLNNRKLWLHLPDRPITLQRQYPLW